MQAPSKHSAPSQDASVRSMAFSALLFLGLVVAAEPDAMLRAVSSSPRWIFFIVLAALSLKFAVSAWSAASTLRLHGIVLPRFSLGRTLSYSFAFNSVLPTVSASFLRTLDATVMDRDTHRRLPAAIGVERITSLFFLLTMGGWGALELSDGFVAARLYLWIFVPVLMSLGAIGFLVFLRGTTDRRLTHQARSLRSTPAAGDPGGNWGAVLFGSLASQMLSVAAFYSLFIALDRTVTLAQCTLIAVVAGCAALIPIGYRSIGVMETAIVAMACALGIGFAEAVLVATTYRFVTLLVSGGSTVWLEERPRVSTQSLSDAVPLAVERSADSRRSSLVSAEFLEFTHDAIIVWEMEGAGILYWNQAAELLYGYSRQEAYGQTTHQLLQTQLSGGTQELEAKIARYGVWMGELRHTTRDGRQVQVEGRLALMSQRDGRWLVLEVNRDITDFKNAQKAQEAAERQLASLRKLVG